MSVFGAENHRVPSHYFDFMGPAVERAVAEPLPGLAAPREEQDYQERHNYLPPPNFLRSLLATESLVNLRDAFQRVQKTYPGRFDFFDIHLRGLFEGKPGRSRLVLPWDVLTYVNFDGHQLYTPVNVSFSHQVMSARWSSDPEIDFATKQRIIEMQIQDVTTYYYPGLNVALYGVSFPEQFSHGSTDKIFREYPSGIWAETETRNALKWRAQKREWDLGENLGMYAFYFFRGKTIDNSDFHRIINDPAFVYFNRAITRAWNDNFRLCMQMNLSTAEEQELAARVRSGILECLGAMPEVANDRSKLSNPYCLPAA